MSELSATVARGLIHSYRDFAGTARALAANLSAKQFWTKPYPYGNSFGHLLLHIIGNLNHFIGAGIAQTGYVRDREREFTEDAPPAKDEVLNRLDEAVALVVATLERQTAGDWSEKYEAADAADFVTDRFTIFLRCATHFHHHVGQMVYLAKELAQ